jgi:hypothetical protein
VERPVKRIAWHVLPPRFSLTPCLSLCSVGEQRTSRQEPDGGLTPTCWGETWTRVPYMVVRFVDFRGPRLSRPNVPPPAGATLRPAAKRRPHPAHILPLPNA